MLNRILRNLVFWAYCCEQMGNMPGDCQGFQSAAHFVMAACLGVYKWESIWELLSSLGIPLKPHPMLPFPSGNGASGAFVFLDRASNDDNLPFAEIFHPNDFLSPKAICRHH